MRIKQVFEYQNAAKRKQEAINNYTIKFFNLYANSRRAVSGITEPELRFIFEQYWDVGQINAIMTDRGVTYTPFAPRDWDIYNYPVHLTPVKRKNVTFIPNKEYTVGVDAVISYVNKAHKPLRTLVEYYVEKIVNIEELIDMNVTANKMPYLFATSPENREKFKRLWEKIQMGEPALFIDIDDVNAFKVLISGSNYILDKLFQAKKDRENEVLTLLGIDNVDVQKKEHLIVDEANANNSLINDNGNVIQDAMDEFFENIKNLFGVEIITERTQKQVSAEGEEMEEEDENNDIQ